MDKHNEWDRNMGKGREGDKGMNEIKERKNEG
jgi:hypothetical protein